MDKSKSRILWIDDEIELLRPHIILLNQKGYQVDTANSGEDGIELVKRNFYDLIFLDEMMLGISGLETLTKIKEINPYLPVVMVTKNEAETLMEEAIGRKIDGYLTKPVNPTQILAICKRFLESERINQEKLIQNFLLDTTAIRNKLEEKIDFEDWVYIYLKLVTWSMELDKYPQLGFSDTLRDLFREVNTVFSNYIEQNYRELINKEIKFANPILSPEIVERYVIPNIDGRTSLFFFVIDCLRLDQWLVMEEVLQQFFIIQREYYLSILPTATPYARNSIFAGLFPYDIQKHYPQFWVGELNTEDHKQNAFEKDLLAEQLNRKRIKLDTPLTYIKIHETEFGKKIENEIHKYVQNRLTAIVVNSVDMIAHSRSDFAILKEIAPNESAYRSLTRSWFNHSSLLGMMQTLSKFPNV
ncbi:MAG: response regulator, partial [Candidatus Kapaibacteriota bacterium]